MMRINIDGPDGNAFVLMGIVQKLSRRNDVGADTSKILSEMKSSDYNNLLKTFNKYFGHLVEIETTDTELNDILSD